MQTLTLVLVMMAHRGDFTPQSDLPYIDALPRDYPGRAAIINKYQTLAVAAPNETNASPVLEPDTTALRAREQAVVLNVMTAS